MIRCSDIVAAARSWLGTPFHHQGRVKGVGVDCAGLVLGVAAELGIAIEDRRGYGRRPDSDELQRLVRARLAELALADARPGDVFLAAIDGRAQHLGFVTEHGILHAYAPAHRVVEHRLDLAWAGRIVGAFRLPGVAPASTGGGAQRLPAGLEGRS